MGGHPRSIFHFYTQVEEAGEVKDIDVASPHSDRLREVFLPSSNGK